jgi:hypothetical protein
LIFSGVSFKRIAMQENVVQRPATARGYNRLSIVSWSLRRTGERARSSQRPEDNMFASNGGSGSFTASDHFL